MNRIHNWLMTLPHLTSLLAVNFVAFWLWARVARVGSQTDMWFCPKKLCFRSSPDHISDNVIKWLSAFDLHNCEQITVFWVCFSAVRGGCRDPSSKIKMDLVQTVKNKTNEQNRNRKQLQTCVNLAASLQTAREGCAASASEPEV